MNPKAGDNAVPPAVKQQTVKQQREAQRAEKTAKFKAEQARKARNKRIGIISAIVGGVVVVGLIVTSIVLIPGSAKYEAGSSGSTVAGVETFENEATHVSTPVDYPQTPPAGGPHNPVWLNCGVYSEPVPNENAVHALEHGAVWLTYDPDAVSDDDIAELRSLMPSTYAVLSPFPDMDTAVAVSAWDAQLKLDSVDSDAISAFFEEYWQSEDAPEPGAPCTGGVDGPGRV
ncbi:DUF3105 domain-containing protein [Amnibacterium flavum]|uniref:DUF3105 domain-containing protein n=1 Tax=Amnibacterium flavum TaxID=2173173 RepID=A0A2V1HWT7_9MICO|nr:DUF3105 domain-containing protein [Amnibacterium flavum]PVZ95699.1 hypothetical protein DDQ50_04245 [Amnibacterium flavum]